MGWSINEFLMSNSESRYSANNGIICREYWSQKQGNQVRRTEQKEDIILNTNLKAMQISQFVFSLQTE